MASRLYDDTRDALESIVVVVDAEALERTSFSQLSDYVAMVALAQVDPDSKPTAPSILGIFDAAGASEQTLSMWDRAFLEALYSTHQRNAAPHSDSSLLARSVARRIEEGQDAEDRRAP
jgi:hypothetical protein